VCALAAAIQLVPLAGPLLLSRDVFAYWDYGRLAAAHDANPYSAPPARFAQDPAERAMAPAWRHSDSVYGPVFTTASAGVAATGGHSSESAALAYRLLAATGMLLLIALAALVGPVPAFAAAFVGWNPLLALDFAGGGHNDVWMMVLVLGGLALAAARPRLAGVSWALAAGVKWIAIALLPLELLGRTQREALRMLLGFAAAAAAIGAVAWLLSCWRSRGCCAPRGPGAPAWRPRPASCSSRAPGSFPGMQSGPCRSQPSRKTGPRGPSRWAFAPIS
jgi:hypothetical protein